MNKKKRAIVLVVAIIIIAGGVFGLTKIKFKASTIVSNQFTPAIAASLASSQKPTTPIIRLNYDKLAIETALYNYQHTRLVDLAKLSDQDKKITDDLKQKTLSLMNSTNSDNPDFILLDSTGATVNQMPTQVGSRGVTSKVETITIVADNFDFAADIPQETKTNLINAYPKIESLYGVRSNTNKIKVVQSPNGCVYGRSCYFPWKNDIELTPGDLRSNFVITHELVHGFHGPYCLRSLWEEGMAESVAEIILSAEGEETALFRNGMDQEFLNISSNDFKDTLTAEGSAPYQWGTAAMYKIYLENSNFYKSFNSSLYPQAEADNPGWDSDPNLIRIASNTTKTIEGEDSLDWFSHQYSFTGISNDFFRSDLSGGLGIFGDKIDGKYVYDTYLDTSKTKLFSVVHITTKDYNDKTLMDCTVKYSDLQFDNGENELRRSAGSVADATFSPNLCATNIFDPSYVGIIQSTAVFDNDNYRVMTTSSLLPGIMGIPNNPNIVASLYLTGSKVVFSNVDTKWSTTSLVKNGLAISNDSATKSAGRYKADVYDSKNILVSTRYFNKAETDSRRPYEVIFNPAPTCSFKTDFKSKNRSITVTLDSTQPCGGVLRLNGIPITRIYGKTATHTFSNLDKNTSYNIGVDATTSYTPVNHSTFSVKTLSADDFKVIKAENIGSVSDGTFRRRYTFNNSYDFSSLAGISAEIGDYDFHHQFEIDVKSVDSKTLDIVPKKTYFNTEYRISGIEEIKDQAGNSLFGYDSGSDNFNIGLNPATKEAPSYSIVENTLSSNGQIKIKTNFKSSQFANKFSITHKNLVNYLLSVPTGKDGLISGDQVAMLGGILAQCSSSPSSGCSAYDLNDDGVVNINDLGSSVDNDTVKGMSTNKISVDVALQKYEKIWISKTQTTTLNWGGTADYVTSTPDNQTIVITFLSSMESGYKYGVITPVIIDDSNNYVYSDCLYVTGVTPQTNNFRLSGVPIANKANKTVSFGLSFANPTTAYISISDTKGKIVRAINQVFTIAGAKTVVWDETNGGGDLVANGTYTLSVTGYDIGSQTTVIGPVSFSLSNPVVLNNFKLIGTPIITGHAVRFRFQFINPTEVTVAITGKSGNTVRNLTQTFTKGGNGEVSWNGLDTNGRPVPRGNYNVRITAVDHINTPTILSSIITLN